MKFKNICIYVTAICPASLEMLHLISYTLNMYDFAEPKICYAFGVDVYMASAWCFRKEGYLLPVFDMVNPLCVMNIHKTDKMMERYVKDTHFFIMGHHFPVIQLLSILE